MKAKLMLLGAILVLTGTIAIAQKTTFGVRGGVNFFNITGRDFDDDKLENKIKAGFNIGINAEIPVGIDFWLQPGVLFTTKGADEVFGTDNKVSVSWIEVPVNFLYKPELGTGKLILGFGPYVAFGAGGQYKFASGNTPDKNVKFKNEVTAADVIANKNFFFKGVDAGANLLFGYQWANRFSAQLNASLGLINIYPPIEAIGKGDTKWNNTGFGISLGYRLAR
jgi:hypothetical protein